MQIPNMPSYCFTGTAIIIGYALSDNFSVLQQAALGAWFNVVGDILASNSAISALYEEETNNINSAKQDDLEVLKEAIEKIRENIIVLQEDKSK